MKIRQGFVSNSSSSSFIIMTTIENHLSALTELSPEKVKVIERIMTNKNKFMGKEVISGDATNSHGCDNFEYIDYDGEGSVYSVFEDYQKLLNRNRDEVFTYDVEI